MKLVCEDCGFKYSTFVEHSSCPRCLSENVREELAGEMRTKLKSPLKPEDGFRGSCPKDEKGQHHWQFVFTGKVCQISECSKCEQLSWKFHRGPKDYMQVEKDLKAYKEQRVKAAATAMIFTMEGSKCSTCSGTEFEIVGSDKNMLRCKDCGDIYVRGNEEFTLDAMSNLKVVYGDIEVAIGIFHKDGKYQFLVPNRDELSLSFVSRINAFKHLIYILSMDSGLKGVIPK